MMSDMLKAVVVSVSKGNLNVMTEFSKAAAERNGLKYKYPDDDFDAFRHAYSMAILVFIL